MMLFVMNIQNKKTGTAADKPKPLVGPMNAHQGDNQTPLPSRHEPAATVKHAGSAESRDMGRVWSPSEGGSICDGERGGRGEILDMLKILVDRMSCFEDQQVWLLL